MIGGAFLDRWYRDNPPLSQGDNDADNAIIADLSRPRRASRLAEAKDIALAWASSA
jgi:hypothetical protein